MQSQQQPLHLKAECNHKCKMKGRGGVKSAQAAFALVCTLVPALFGRADAALVCSGSGNVYDSSGCRAADINAKFPGAKVVCFNNNYLASNSAANAQATVDAINNIASHALYGACATCAIQLKVSARARIFVLCSDPAFG